MLMISSPQPDTEQSLTMADGLWSSPSRCCQLPNIRQDCSSRRHPEASVDGSVERLGHILAKAGGEVTCLAFVRRTRYFSDEDRAKLGNVDLVPCVRESCV